MTLADGGEAPKIDVASEGVVAVRARVSRFTQIRSALRSLPLTASEMEQVGPDDALAATVYDALKPLADDPALATRPLEGLLSELAQVDLGLDRMAEALLGRLDRVPFAELRASIPRAVEARRHDVLGLVDIMVQDRDKLLDRLSVLEYFVTNLATEEVGRDRKVVHDPVTLTPSLAQVANEQDASDEAEAVALELFQADRPDEPGNDLDWLRSTRARKDALGMARLAPNVLRAVVTYNARVFNRLAAAADGDPFLEAMVGDPSTATGGDGAPAVGAIDDTDDIWTRVGVPEEAESLFDHDGLASVLDALRQRLQGAALGQTAAERVGVALDVARLERIEIDAILSRDPDEAQTVLSYSSVIGLLLGDVGVIRSQLVDLGIVESTLSYTWLFEIERALAALISSMVADATRYDLTSKLSGIKAKHFLAPMQRMRERTPAAPVDGPEADVDDPSEAPEGNIERAPARHARRGPPTVRPEPDARRPSVLLRQVAASRRARAALVAAIATILAIVGANRLSDTPTNVASLEDRDLARLSPYLTSAYRNENGEGAIVIGRVDADFEKLSPPRQEAMALDLVRQFERDGAREVMAYGPKGRMLIHYVDGVLRRPRRLASAGRG